MPPPGRLPASGVEDPWLSEHPEPPSWVTGDAEPPPLCLPEDAGPVDPEGIDAWLDRELAKAAPWLADDPWLAEDVELGDIGGDGLAPAPLAGSGKPVEVLKAGRWDRTQGNGGGFAAGGLADHLPPGPVLAGLARRPVASRIRAAHRR